MNYKYIIRFLLLCLVLNSCKTVKKVPYFQDAENGSSVKISDVQEVRIRPKDKISIIVNCKDQQLSALFNLPYVTNRMLHMGVSTATPYSSESNAVSGYTVDVNGDIDFPIIGKVHVDGLTRSEVAQLIKEKITSSNQAKDPVVTVEFLNLTVTVIGEVNKPGGYRVDKDQVTVIDAIGMAGDLTIQGKRENVKVLRNEGGEKKTYVVNLNSLGELTNSPAYYLQQDDVVYVEPNKKKARQATVNGNGVLSASFWVSLASLITTISFFAITH